LYIQAKLDQTILNRPLNTVLNRVEIYLLFRPLVIYLDSKEFRALLNRLHRT